MNSKDFAFPFSVLPDKYQPMLVPGLTKREYFSSAILQGLCANPAQIFTEMSWRELANNAVQLSDDLIKELEKETK